MNRRANEIADIGSLLTLSEVLQCDTTFPEVPALEHETELISQGLLAIEALCEIQKLVEKEAQDHRILQQAVAQYAYAKEGKAPSDDELVTAYSLLPQTIRRVSAKLRVMRVALELCIDGYGNVVPEENRCEMGRLFGYLCEASAEGGKMRDTLELYTRVIYAEMKNEMIDEERHACSYWRRDVP